MAPRDGVSVAVRGRFVLRLAIVVGLALVTQTAPPPARAEFEAGDLQPIVTAGFVPGNGDSEDVEITELRLGLGHYFRERLGFYGEVSLYRPSGQRDARTVDTAALGLAFAVRWHFLRRSSFGLYTDWGMGVMAGLDPFPPAGTNANGTPHFGVGLSARLRQRMQLLVGLRHLHMSNGKGLVAENPSFDGLGAYLGVTLEPGFRAPRPPVGESLPFGGGALRVRADATFEDGDEENSPGGTLAMDLLLLQSAQLYAQLAGSAAELAGETIWEAALHIYRETATGRLAVGYSHKEFNVFTSDFFNLQIERVLNDISTVEFVAAHERKNLDDDRVFGGLFIVVYPSGALALRSGIGFESQEREFFDSLENLNDAGFNFGVEWFPGPVADLGLSFFLSEGIGSDVWTAGLRFQPGGKRSLRERHRAGSFVPLR
jgi:hypothetical protein